MNERAPTKVQVWLMRAWLYLPTGLFLLIITIALIFKNIATAYLFALLLWAFIAGVRALDKKFGLSFPGRSEFRARIAVLTIADFCLVLTSLTDGKRHAWSDVFSMCALFDFIVLPYILFIGPAALSILNYFEGKNK